MFGLPQLSTCHHQLAVVVHQIYFNYVLALALHKCYLCCLVCFRVTGASGTRNTRLLSGLSCP